MKTLHWALVGTLLLAPSAIAAQVEIASAPPEISLLNMFVRKWSSESSLGDLRTLALDDADIEVRAWGGFGLVGTSALIARRAAGHWQAWRAIVHTCSLWIPIVGNDRLTDEAIARYRIQARAQCGTPQRDLPPVHIISVDTLEISPIVVDAAILERAWRNAIDAGLLTLPPTSKARILDGFHYVIEVRMGRVYRASELPRLPSTDTDANGQIQRVFAALTQLTP